MIPTMLMVAVAAYGRLVRGDPMPHVIIVVIAASFFSFTTWPVIPAEWGFVAILLNTGVFLALFFVGRLIGRRLDRDKYADYGDDEDSA